MATVVTVNGIEVGFLQGQMEITKSMDGQRLARFTVQSHTGAARPVRDQDVIVTIDGTRRFGGLVDTLEETSTGGEPQTNSEDYIVNAIGYGIYADYRNVVNGGFVEGTLLVTTALPALLGFLSPNGVTLDASGISDFSLPHSPYDVRTIRSISDEIAMQFDISWEITDNKVYRWFVQGTTGAPFNIADGNNDNDVDDITVEYANQDVYNYVIGRLGSGAREITDTFTGDGATTAFTINYFPLVAHRGYVTNAGVFETLSIGGGGTWDYDPTTGVVTRTSAPANGNTIEFIYTAQFPVAIISDGAVTPQKELVVDLTNIFDKAAGQLIIDNIRLTSQANPRLVHYRTRRHGLEPGMFQSIVVAKKNLNVVGYIQEVVARHQEGNVWIYDVTFLEGLSRVNSWKSIYGEWAELGGGGSNVSAGTGTVVSGSSAAPPSTSVQFNRSGGFGGDESFKYNEVTNSLVMGLNSSITAANHESCFVMGDDCHITD